MGPMDVVGMMASVLSIVLWFPQARTSWKNRHDPHAFEGLSLGTPLLVIANAVCWFVYAALLGSFWAGAPGIINVPLAVFNIVLKLRAQHALARQAVSQCGGECLI